MRTKVATDWEEREKRVRDIRRATRRQYSAEEKIRIVIAGLRGEDTIAELCRKQGLTPEPLLSLVEGFPGGRSPPPARL
jgi:transposase